MKINKYLVAFTELGSIATPLGTFQAYKVGEQRANKHYKNVHRCGGVDFDEDSELQDHEEAVILEKLAYDQHLPINFVAEDLILVNADRIIGFSGYMKYDLMLPDEFFISVLTIQKPILN